MDNNTQNDFIKSLLQGLRDGFETCELIMEALSYKRAIPESFWTDEKKGAYGILGEYRISMKEMRDLRAEAIMAITSKISLMERENNKKNQIDNFSRLFHALTLLQVEKNTSLVPAVSENLLYNTAYSLWAIDDGSEKIWKLLKIMLIYDIIESDIGMSYVVKSFSLNSGGYFPLSF